MAVNFAQKKASFVSRYSIAVVNLLAAADVLTALNTEFADMTYGGGGGNQLIDAEVEVTLPACTAAQFDSAEGAAVTVVASVTTNRGYLEMVRP